MEAWPNGNTLIGNMILNTWNQGVRTSWQKKQDEVLWVGMDISNSFAIEEKLGSRK